MPPSERWHPVRRAPLVATLAFFASQMISAVVFFVAITITITLSQAVAVALAVISQPDMTCCVIAASTVITTMRPCGDDTLTPDYAERTMITWRLPKLLIYFNSEACDLFDVDIEQTTISLLIPATFSVLCWRYGNIEQTGISCNSSTQVCIEKNAWQPSEIQYT